MKLSCAFSLGLFLAVPLLAADAKQATVPATGLQAGFYQIRNQKFGELLRPEDARSANGTPLVLYPAQPWKCMTWHIRPAGAEAFQLQNHFTSKTFGIDTKTGDAGNAVVQVPFPKESSEPPAWKFIKLADGSYQIVEPQSGKALTASKNNPGTGTRIVVQPWAGKDEQKWQLEQIDPSHLTM